MRVDPEPTLKQPRTTLVLLGFGSRVRQDEDMPTPYERPASTQEARTAERRAARRVFSRPAEGKVIAGVAAGLAEHLGWSVWWVRAAFVLTSIPTGAGLVAYVFLWALSPQSRDGVVRGGRRTMDPAAAPVASAVDPEEAREEKGERDATRVLVVGGLVLLVGLVVVAQNAGFNARLGILVPLLVVAVGAVIAWSQLDEAQRGRWLGSESGTRRFSAARFV